jgi:hypothetical protein
MTPREESLAWAAEDQDRALAEAAERARQAEGTTAEAPRPSRRRRFRFWKRRDA